MEVNALSRLMLGTVLMLVAAVASAQTVYKCTDKLGNPIFTTDPCGADAKATTYGTAAAKKKESGNPEPAAAPRSNSAVQAISDSVADSNCRRSAERLFDFAAAQQVDRAQVEINSLGKSHWTGGSAAQRQTMERLDEQQILTLQQTISQERMRIDESRKRVADALAECDKRKDQADQARLKQ